MLVCTDWYLCTSLAAILPVTDLLQWTTVKAATSAPMRMASGTPSPIAIQTAVKSAMKIQVSWVHSSRKEEANQGLSQQCNWLSRVVS